MPLYTVTLTPPGLHTIPPLLTRFGTWLAKQEYGSVGWFGLLAQEVADGWEPAALARLNRAGFAFLRTPDGGQVVLLTSGAVVLLGSEGETGTVAGSLEELLHLLARGATGVADLDEDDAPGRSKLRAWLARNKVVAPQAEPPDFAAYLDGTTPTTPTPAVVASEPVADLPPMFARLVALVGRRADDPEVIAYVTNMLGQKVPTSTTDVGQGKNVVAKKHGLELHFDHDIKNEKYPLVPTSKKAYLPYLSLAWINKNWAEALPFDLAIGQTADDLTARHGAPRPGRWPDWQWTLDPARDVELTADGKTITVSVSAARELSGRHGSPARPVVGLFVAWALQRDLLRDAAFPGHAALIGAVRRRERQGTALADAALPRGLWDSHLKPLPGLREFAYGWFRNIGGSYIRDDLVSVFGARKGSTGHAEPVLDDDTWEAVEQATQTLDARFAQWVRA